MTKIERTARFFDSMSKLGFSYSEAQTLRRIELTLQRWAEKECGDGNDWGSWAIERGEAVDLRLINWPDANGNVWLVESRETRFFPLKEINTKDANSIQAKAVLRREQALHVPGKPYLVHHHYMHGKGKDTVTRTPIPDREKGALDRLAKIMARHPELWSYHQSDPRGCQLYIGRKSDLNGQDVQLNYNLGFAVCV